MAILPDFSNHTGSWHILQKWDGSLPSHAAQCCAVAHHAGKYLGATNKSGHCWGNSMVLGMFLEWGYLGYLKNGWFLKENPCTRQSGCQRLNS